MTDGRANALAQESFDLCHLGFRTNREEVLQEAVELFEKALKIDRSVASNMFFDVAGTPFAAYGNWLFSQKRYEEAKKFMSQAVSCNPEQDVLYYNLFLIECFTGDTDSAIGNIFEAVCRSPENGKYWGTVGQMLSEAGAPECGLAAIFVAESIDKHTPRLSSAKKIVLDRSNFTSKEIRRFKKCAVHVRQQCLSQNQSSTLTPQAIKTILASSIH